MWLIFHTFFSFNKEKVFFWIVFQWILLPPLSGTTTKKKIYFLYVFPYQAWVIVVVVVLLDGLDVVVVLDLEPRKSDKQNRIDIRHYTVDTIQ